MILSAKMSNIMANSSFSTGSSLREKAKFQRVADPPTLLPILERRLPNSCFMYNQLKAYESCKSDLEVYSLHPFDENPNPEEIWILFNFSREDWGPTLSFSAPPLPPTKEIPTRIQEALETTTILDWTKPFICVAVDLPISDFIVKLNTRKYGNNIKIFPSYLLYMDPKEALKLDVPTNLGGDPPAELRSLSPLEGTQFLTKNWQYSKAGTDIFIRKCIENHVSAGVFVKNGDNTGEFVCGVINPGFGLASSLVTHPDYRRKGYASLAMKYLIKNLAKNGFHPCWDVEMSETAAVAFHKSLNPQIIAKVDYVSHNAL
ncbi:Glycine N-acyltransferase-like protein 3 [Orchesella cincta]|uniref:Glycine N-acyltransferase-like protein 3 n=1 Tax=Orchesella cincta TaxID=48709 RepID=A0A1D2MFQ8_ORCCI|nr:Glycine N-acyltransferase-like protein 3 [Orchesella cincta]